MGNRRLARNALWNLLSLTLPVLVALGVIPALIRALVTPTAGLRVIFEARQFFGSLSILRTLTGVLTFAGPLAAAKLYGGLPAVILAIAAVRLLSLAAHALLCVSMTADLLCDRRVRL